MCVCQYGCVCESTNMVYVGETFFVHVHVLHMPKIKKNRRPVLYSHCIQLNVLQC